MSDGQRTGPVHLSHRIPTDGRRQSLPGYYCVSLCVFPCVCKPHILKSVSALKVSEQAEGVNIHDLCRVWLLVSFYLVLITWELHWPPDFAKNWWFCLLCCASRPCQLGYYVLITFISFSRQTWGTYEKINHYLVTELFIAQNKSLDWTSQRVEAKIGRDVLCSFCVHSC